MMHQCLGMYQIRKEIEIMDDEKAYQLCASYFNKKGEKKKAIFTGIYFVQSVCATKGKDILAKLERDSCDNAS